MNFEIVAPESGILLKILYGEKTIPRSIYGGHRGGPGEDSAFLTKAAEKKEAVKDKAAVPEKRARVASGEVKAFPAAKMLAKNRASTWLKFKEPEPKEG